MGESSLLANTIALCKQAIDHFVSQLEGSASGETFVWMPFKATILKLLWLFVTHKDGTMKFKYLTSGNFDAEGLKRLEDPLLKIHSQLAQWQGLELQYIEDVLSRFGRMFYGNRRLDLSLAVTNMVLWLKQIGLKDEVAKALASCLDEDGYKNRHDVYDDIYFNIKDLQSYQKPQVLYEGWSYTLGIGLLLFR
jgi:hypothetical protein